MKAITSNGSIDTLIEIANALAWLSYAIRHCAYDARFHELLIRATKAPVLVYSPSEDRGWVVPKLLTIQKKGPDLLVGVIQPLSFLMVPSGTVSDCMEQVRPGPILMMK